MVSSISILKEKKNPSLHFLGAWRGFVLPKFQETKCSNKSNGSKRPRAT